MFNHARTLLMNVDGTAAIGDATPGEEAVPAGFKAVALPTYLQQLRGTLFGSDPDRAMLNYRLHQYMTLLHSVTALEQYVVSLDSRVTYNHRSTSLFASSLETPTQRRLSGSGHLSLNDTASAPEPIGRMRYELEVGCTGGTVTVIQVVPRRSTVVSTPTFSGGLSAAVTLGETGYSVLVPDVTASWLVSGFKRPTWDLGQIAAALSVAGEPVLVALFGTTAEEPYASFRNMFMTQHEVPLKLGGLLLAVIYRTDVIYRSAYGR